MIFETSWDRNKNQKKDYFLHLWSAKYQNRVKGGEKVISKEILGKIFKNKDFGIEIFEKGQTLSIFLVLAPSKLIY